MFTYRRYDQSVERDKEHGHEDGEEDQGQADSGRVVALSSRRDGRDGLGDLAAIFLLFCWLLWLVLVFLRRGRRCCRGAVDIIRSVFALAEEHVARGGYYVGCFCCCC